MTAKGGEWPVIGIDLGTTYSCVAVWRHDSVQIIPNDQGNRTTPSCVAFSDSERLIGEAAVNQAAMNPSNTIFATPCPNRNQYVFWDAYHTTEAANAILAQRAFDGPQSDYFPINFHQLALI